MTRFDDLIEEAAGFGLAAHIDTTELRLLYYGRKDLYAAFTHEGEISTSPKSNEIDRPDSIVCYDVKDIVGRKASSNLFYANIFRVNKNRGKFLNDIRLYSRDDFRNDVAILRAMKIIKEDEFNQILGFIQRDTSIRHDFMRLWILTEAISKSKSSRNYSKIWRDTLMDLGYVGFSDPSRTGYLLGTREQVTIYLDYDSRVDLDILEIQKHRTDPRRRIRDRVERKVRRMGVSRNRIAKRRKD